MADELGRSHAWLARRLRARGLGRLIHAKHGKRVDVDTLTRRLGFADLADYAQQRAATGHSLVAMARELGHSDTWLAGRLRAAGLGHLINPPGRPRARTRKAGVSREPPAVHSGTSN